MQSTTGNHTRERIGAIGQSWFSAQTSTLRGNMFLYLWLGFLPFFSVGLFLFYFKNLILPSLLPSSPSLWVDAAPFYLPYFAEEMETSGGSVSLTTSGPASAPILPSFPLGSQEAVALLPRKVMVLCFDFHFLHLLLIFLSCVISLSCCFFIGSLSC